MQPTPSIRSEGVGQPTSHGVALGAGPVWGASVLVLAACAMASFRLGFGERAGDLLALNGPRLLFAAAVGAALAIAGALRLRAAVPERPLRELGVLALSTGAAGGGFALAEALPGLPAGLAFAGGALAGAGLLFALVRALESRPSWPPLARRASNLGVAAALAAMIAIAALAGAYARARGDFVAPAVAWLLGDLGGARLASGAALLAAAALLGAHGARALARGDAAAARTASWLALGIGVGAAGPLAFVGGMVPRAVRVLAPRAGAGAGAALAASAAAGAATVAAIDAVPRLLVGGYDFRFNVPAALLAVPIYLLWNRARLRREAGRAGWAFEAAELAAIAGLTALGVALAAFLTDVIRFAT